jgi:CysZ protein
MTFEYAAYAFENNNIRFNEQKEYLSTHRTNTLLFGGLSLFATATPIVNMFAPAVAVAGATKMLYEQGLLQERSQSVS